MTVGCGDCQVDHWWLRRFAERPCALLYFPYHLLVGVALHSASRGGWLLGAVEVHGGDAHWPCWLLWYGSGAFLAVWSFGGLLLCLLGPKLARLWHWSVDSHLHAWWAFVGGLRLCLVSLLVQLLLLQVLQEDLVLFRKLVNRARNLLILWRMWLIFCLLIVFILSSDRLRDVYLCGWHAGY